MGKCNASEINNIETLWIKLAEAKAKQSAKQLKKQTSKSGGKSVKATWKTKDCAAEELGSGDNKSINNRDPLADDDASGNWSKRAILINWSDPSLFHLTDTLLTKIEDSETFCQAFGFVKTGNNTNNSQGKKNQEHYADLTTKVFHDHDSPNEWCDTSIKELGNVVKNRVTK
ncbi:hypothetical protein DFH94DRAFT_699488 [Russula ochroleuca]|uniref:Uncharacterized protein n=1 Tax=Russula ochroleuca TaxID=152965 RepID=A0A9P5MPX6_9AGAM|nr:hypothetical protein DFH94DRAFT_699488 [Russula ochroleuca]